ncbi:MAG: protein-glutamate O-methyltransferase CheR [Geobacteraceae bacterium]|nr:protein-glutamate O-methyltransferase CheR [Geobacteraceae bacterium]
MVSDRSLFEISDDEFSHIRKTLLFHRGFKLDAYKDRCVRRRIAIRIRANHCESAQDYCNLLVSDKTEIDRLLKVLTIHVSQFFRNLSTFEKLREKIIPQIFATARQTGKKRLRFWSLGCSSGEEPYSLALILAEHFAKELEEIPVTIDATDVDTSIIQTAEKALYNHDRLIETPINYISRYFIEENHQYRLSPTITKMVSFRIGEMFNSLIYDECDLLLCRNVLIYFAREQQEQVLADIARVVNKDGFLVLGKSETLLGQSRSHFQTICPLERIYSPVKSFQTPTDVQEV